MNLKKLIGSVGEIVAGLPGNVAGELAGDLVEKALETVKEKHHRNKFVRDIRAAIEEFGERVPNAQEFLKEVSANVPSRRRFRRGDRTAADIARDAIDGIDGYNVEEKANELLRGVSMSKYGNFVRTAFVDLLCKIQHTAVEYWKSLIDSQSMAVVNLVARTVVDEGAKMREALRRDLTAFMFAPSGAPMSEGGPLKTAVLTCDNCGASIDPSSLHRTDVNGIFACRCPECGTPLSFGKFSDAGADWAKECKSMIADLSLQMRDLSEKLDGWIEENRKEHGETRKTVAFWGMEILNKINELIRSLNGPKKDRGNGNRRSRDDGDGDEKLFSPDGGRGERTPSKAAKPFAWIFGLAVAVLTIPIISMVYEENFRRLYPIWLGMLGAEFVLAVCALICVGRSYNWRWGEVFNSFVIGWCICWVLPFLIMTLVVTFAHNINVLAAHWGILLGIAGGMLLFGSPIVLSNFEDCGSSQDVVTAILIVGLVLASSMPVYVAAIY